MSNKESESEKVLEYKKDVIKELNKYMSAMKDAADKSTNIWSRYNVQVACDTIKFILENIL